MDVVGRLILGELSRAPKKGTVGPQGRCFFRLHARAGRSPLRIGDKIKMLVKIYIMFDHCNFSAAASERREHSDSRTTTML